PKRQASPVRRRGREARVDGEPLPNGGDLELWWGVRSDATGTPASGNQPAGWAPRTPTRLADGLGAEGCPVAPVRRDSPQRLVPPLSRPSRETRRSSTACQDPGAGHWTSIVFDRQGDAPFLNPSAA